MNIGLFLLIEPFASVEQQLKCARDMGFSHADITDTNAGGSMLGTAGFCPTISLDENPLEVRRLFEKYGMTPLTVCAHADPTGRRAFRTRKASSSSPRSSARR